MSDQEESWGVGVRKGHCWWVVCAIDMYIYGMGCELGFLPKDMVALWRVKICRVEEGYMS